MPAVAPEGSAPLDVTLAQEVARAIADLRYGTVELTIHDGRIVQIERREKIRVAERPPDRK